MNLTDTQITILFVIAMLLALALNFFIKKRRHDRAPIGMAVNLLSDLKKNKKLMENFSHHWQTKMFRTRNWERNKTKISFIPQDLRNELSKIYEPIVELNQRIETAKRHKTDGYMAGIESELDKLKVPLEHGQERLREWVKENMGNQDFYPKRRGIFR